MFEYITYEGILQKMLNRVPNSMDKREGSIIYDALAPAAMELMESYIELERVLNESFADTQSRKYLIRRAGERGLTPLPATNAVLKGEFNIDIKINSRFSCGDLNYIAVERISEGIYKMECEIVGVIGNKNFGDLIPIEYIEGLTSAKLTELLIPGQDEEETEIFRKRYFDSFDKNAYGGNKADYVEKTNSLRGVGTTKVTPVWNGGGTVLLTILNSEFNVATDELIKEVQDAIDPTQDATGLGIAPIGHIVTVKTADSMPINISAKFIFSDGYNFVTAKKDIEKAIEDYLLELRKRWGNENYSTIRTLQISARILNNVEGILDVIDIKINGVEDNLILGEYQVPVFGSVANE